MSYQYYDKWYDKNNTPYNKKKRETTMSIRDAPQEKVGKAHKKTTNERGRPGNPDDEALERINPCFYWVDEHSIRELRPICD